MENILENGKMIKEKEKEYFNKNKMSLSNDDSNIIYLI